MIKNIHILFKSYPNTTLSKFINDYKKASNRLIKKEFSIIKNKLWKKYFWTIIYYLITTD